MNTETLIEKLTSYGLQIKPEIFRPAEGLLRYPYLSAGIKKTYPDLVDWDAVWAGLFYLELGDAEPLKYSLLNLIDHILPDGKGQRRIGTARYSAPPFQIRPFLATAAWLLTDKTDPGWLDSQALEKIHRYLEYFHIHRTGRSGLLKWLHVDEGFADNGLGNWTWEPLSVEAVDLNAQMVIEHRCFAALCDRAAHPDYASRHRAYADRLAQQIHAVLWNEEYGFYFSLYNPPERAIESSHIEVVHYTNLWPLWAGITPDDCADAVIRKYLLDSEHLLSPFGIRSMSASDPFYNNMVHGYTTPMLGSPQNGPVFQKRCSNWQGPVWALSTYLGVMCLARYGYRAEAESVAENFTTFLHEKLEQNGCFHENYNADSGEALAAPGIASWYLPAIRMLTHLDTPLFQWPDGL